MPSLAIEIGDVDRALAGRRDEPHARAERLQHRRRVGRRHREARRARRRDPARLAVLLHAVADRPAPLVGLVVVGAARVEAEVAADRRHVAQMRRRDLRRGLPQAGTARAQPLVAHERRQRRRRADRAAPPLWRTSARAGDLRAGRSPSAASAVGASCSARDPCRRRRSSCRRATRRGSRGLGDRSRGARNVEATAAAS